MSSSEIPNSRKHHFDPARFTVARLEETNEVGNLYADLVSTYRPVNSQELFALERMALCQQAMLRAARLESGLFTSCLNESFGPEGAPSLPFRQEMAEGIEITRDLNRNFILADGFRLLARQGNSIPLFLRYQVQAERLYRRAVEEFERLKKLRPELQFEANPSDGLPPAETPKPQSDEPLPALDPSRSNGHQAKHRPPSARCRRPVAPANDVGQAISSLLLVPPGILSPVLFALYRRRPKVRSESSPPVLVPPAVFAAGAVAAENLPYFPQPWAVNSISSKSRAAPSPVSVRIT